LIFRAYIPYVMFHFKFVSHRDELFTAVKPFQFSPVNHVAPMIVTMCRIRRAYIHHPIINPTHASHIRDWVSVLVYRTRCVRELGKRALDARSLREMRIAERNGDFTTCGEFDLDLESISIPKIIERVEVGCFSRCQTISKVYFESSSRLCCIEEFAFSQRSSLSSICIPSSVERLSTRCFSGCPSLYTVIFASRWNLSSIAKNVFSTFFSLSLICLLMICVCLNASGFRRGHSNLFQLFPQSHSLHFAIVHHLHLFAFRRL
jgi:hypothetical protein